MKLSLRQVEQLAPDQSSLTAAGKLRKPGLWPLRARNDDGTLIWGECQGSGSTPYRLSVALDDLGYRCTCPSRKFPCKHVLALMWQCSENSAEFALDEPPAWVMEWLVRRRPAARAPAAAKADTGPADRPAISRVVSEDPADGDAEIADDVRAAERREKQRAAREEGIRRGLDELDRWILDQLDRGLAGFPSIAGEQCRLAARRLVDAKAPGLASLVDELAAELFRVAEPGRNAFVMERLAQLHLIVEAYRRQDLLPEPLRQDVRRAVGWQQRREELLQDSTAPRGRGHWIVAGTRSEIQADRLRRLETWLMRADGEGPDFALLLDFVPASAGPAASPFVSGEAFWAELGFFPSAAPLRAVVAERRPAEGSIAWPFADRTLSRALEAYDEALRQLPWLACWPIACGDATVAELNGAFVLTDAETAVALPVAAPERERLIALVGLEGIALSGLWDGRGVTLLGADTPLGRWSAA